jgi:hypothetical protein
VGCPSFVNCWSTAALVVSYSASVRRSWSLAVFNSASLSLSNIDAGGADGMLKTAVAVTTCASIWSGLIFVHMLMVGSADVRKRVEAGGRTVSCDIVIAVLLLLLLLLLID